MIAALLTLTTVLTACKKNELEQTSDPRPNLTMSVQISGAENTNLEFNAPNNELDGNSIVSTHSSLENAFLIQVGGPSGNIFSIMASMNELSVGNYDMEQTNFNAPPTVYYSTNSGDLSLTSVEQYRTVATVTGTLRYYSVAGNFNTSASDPVSGNDVAMVGTFSGLEVVAVDY